MQRIIGKVDFEGKEILSALIEKRKQEKDGAKSDVSILWRKKNGTMVWRVRTRIMLERGMRWIRRTQIEFAHLKRFALEG